MILESDRTVQIFCEKKNIICPKQKYVHLIFLCLTNFHCLVLPLYTHLFLHNRTRLYFLLFYIYTHLYNNNFLLACVYVIISMFFILYIHKFIIVPYYREKLLSYAIIYAKFHLFDSTNVHTHRKNTELWRVCTKVFFVILDSNFGDF